MTQPRASWMAPPETLRLSARDLHVWKASLDLAPMWVQRLAETLSEDERARTGRFFLERDRSRFIACRGALRTILGRYLRAAPRSIELRYSPHGKPAVSIGPGGNDIRFNVSHSHGMALYGVTIGREIGIDLERINSDFASDEIAEGFLSRSEVAALRALNPASRVEAFFRCWTRKEAYIKARGEGLSLPSKPATLLSTPDDPHEASRWSVRELFVGPDYVAAIAVEGHNWQLQSWQHGECKDGCASEEGVHCVGACPPRNRGMRPSHPPGERASRPGHLAEFSGHHLL